MRRPWQRKPAGPDSESSRLIKVADEARNRKDWQTAAKNYAAAVSAAPDRVDILIQHAHALKELGEYEQASASYYSALDRMPDNDDLHLQIGHIEKLKNNFHQALLYYQRSVDLNPSNHHARTELDALKYKLSQSHAITTTLAPRNLSMEDGDKLPAVAINITGGLGDYIVIARYLRDLQAATEPFRFDVFCNYQRAAHWIFSKIPGYRTCYNEILFDYLIREYTLSLRINQFVVVHHEAADWYALRKFPRLVDVLHKIVRFRPEIEVFIEHHPLMDGFLAQKAVYMNCTRANFLHKISDIKYGGDLFNIDMDVGLTLKKFSLTGRNYITVHNGFDPGVVINAETATKCYPHYDRIIDYIKKTGLRIEIIQLGVSNSSPIKGADLDLTGKTTLEEAAAIMSAACLHLDHESGLVHLATALGVKCCVIFGPTALDYFGYKANLNIGPNFCGGCWWINDTWMQQCPRGFAEARCMTEHDPSAIAAVVMRAIENAESSPHQHPAAGTLMDTESVQGPMRRP